MPNIAARFGHDNLDFFDAGFVIVEGALNDVTLQCLPGWKSKHLCLFHHVPCFGIHGKVNKPAVFMPDRNGPIYFAPFDDDDETFEELMVKLDALVGLTEIKEKVRDHAKYIQYLQLRKELGYQEKESVNVHSVFIGNPGTGKTTVAKMMGRLYRKMGLLTRGHVHVVDRVDLVGEYIGQTAPKVKEAIEKARGGVLFIDEAYSLVRSQEDTKDFGREVIEILVKDCDS